MKHVDQFLSMCDPFHQHISSTANAWHLTTRVNMGLGHICRVLMVRLKRARVSGERDLSANQIG